MTFLTGAGRMLLLADRTDEDIVISENMIKETSFNVARKGIRNAYFIVVEDAENMLLRESCADIII